MKVDCLSVSLKNLITLVMTAKFSPEVFCNQEFEGSAWVHFTILVFSIFNTS
jgi:hypothetical protein